MIKQVKLIVDGREELYCVAQGQLDHIRSYLKPMLQASGDAHEVERLPEFHGLMTLRMNDVLFLARQIKTSVDSIGEDLIHRGCIPSKQQVKNLNDQISACQSALQVYITKCKEQAIPKWKTIWKSELDRITQEESQCRQTMAHAEVIQDEIKEDIEAWEAIKEVIAKRAPYAVHSGDLLSMSEISNSDGSRSREITADNYASLPTSPASPTCSEQEFIEELQEFVVFSKLRDTGGIGRVERDRVRKQDTWLYFQS